MWWIIKRANADYYYSHYDARSDLPIYTKHLEQARIYRTKKEAKENTRYGDMVVKKEDCKGG